MSIVLVTASVLYLESNGLTSMLIEIDGKETKEDEQGSYEIVGDTVETTDAKAHDDDPIMIFTIVRKDFICIN